LGFQLGLGIWTLARSASREQTAMIVTRVCSRPAATAAGSRFSDDLFTSAWLGNTSPRHSACPAMIRVSLSSHRGKAANRSPRRGHAQCQVWVGMCVPHCAYVRAGLCRCAYPSFGVVEHVPQFPQYDATCARPFCICATTEHSECALHKVTGWAVVSGCSAETVCIRNPS